MALEKGKGLALGKLRNITLIKGDIQINMCIKLWVDEEELIEKDSRFDQQITVHKKTILLK